MDYTQLVQKVKQYAGLETTDDAVKIIQATLETMSERLPRTHRLHLAAQLPDELRQFLPRQAHMEYLSLEEFYRRVADRSDLSYQHAVRYAEAVARVLQEAVAPGELEDILSGFPDEYHELFGRKPAGPLSPSSV
jgi:uncharacterized protein (DUF2267 family)